MERVRERRPVVERNLLPRPEVEVPRVAPEVGRVLVAVWVFGGRGREAGVCEVRSPYRTYQIRRRGRNRQTTFFAAVHVVAWYRRLIAMRQFVAVAALNISQRKLIHGDVEVARVDGHGRLVLFQANANYYV